MAVAKCVATEKEMAYGWGDRKNMEKGKQKVTHRKGRAVVAIVVVVVIMLALTAGIVIYNTPSNRLTRKLDLGNRYLEEQNYEQAIVAFDLVIAIDPKNVEAYLGKADAYIGLGNTERALAVLERGYETTGDERLKARINEIMMEEKADKQEVSVEQMDDEVVLEEKVRVRNEDRNARINEIQKLLIDVGIGDSSGYETHLLTHEQIRSAYVPIAKELEEYLENESGTWELTAWMCLANIYLHMGDMDKCLEIRRRGFDATDSNSLRPEPDTDSSGQITRDEYGRKTIGMDGTIYTYGDADYLLSWYDEGDRQYEYVVYAHEYEYDSEGRIDVYSWESIERGAIIKDRYEFEYQAGNTVLVKWFRHEKGSEHLYITKLTYDEYGVLDSFTPSNYQDWEKQY